MHSNLVEEVERDIMRVGGVCQRVVLGRQPVPKKCMHLFSLSTAGQIYDCESLQDFSLEDIFINDSPNARAKSS